MNLRGSGIICGWVVMMVMAACNQGGVETANDSLAQDSMGVDTSFVPDSTAITASGDVIRINRGEWYERVTFAGYDADRNMLIFEKENGELRELVSQPWNRLGKLQLHSKRDIRLTENTLYEIIYQYRYEDPKNPSSLPSGMYLTDIAPRGGCFPEGDRYINQSAETIFRLAAQAVGQFYDDLNGGAVLLQGSSGLPTVFYSVTPSAEKFSIPVKILTGNVLRIRLPQASQDGFLRWKDGEWHYTDGEGKRRVFRPSRM